MATGLAGTDVAAGVGATVATGVLVGGTGVAIGGAVGCGVGVVG